MRTRYFTKLCRLQRPPDHVFGLLTNFFSGPILFNYFRGRDGREHLYTSRFFRKPSRLDRC